MSINNNKETHALSHWLETLSDDPLLVEIQQTPAFKRLWGISFLGAIDYLYPAPRSHLSGRSRASHSRNVAALANFVATRREYATDLKRHIITAALLHDIGHAPLSHSVEPYFKSVFGLGHHELGGMALQGETPLAESLAALLKRHYDVDLIQSYIDGKAESDIGGDLFSSRINIDTIDGILRTHAVCAGFIELDPINVARGSFLDDSGERLQVLDDFWSLKHRVYNDFITSRNGVLADWYSQAYFNERPGRLNQDDLLEDESVWKQAYPGLFKDLEAVVATRGDTPDTKAEGSIGYVRRDYVIDKEVNGPDRYHVRKTKARMEVVH